jgi:hypothetical protein
LKLTVAAARFKAYASIEDKLSQNLGRESEAVAIVPEFRGKTSDPNMNCMIRNFCGYQKAEIQPVGHT